MITTAPYHDSLIEHLAANPKEAVAYLNAVAEDGEIKYLLKALRNVVEAQGGVGALAKKTKLSRTTLYKTLSATGNPEVATLDAILAVYGIRIGFFTVAPSRAGHRQNASRAASAGAQAR
jgi:probable addiction module antidote protein